MLTTLVKGFLFQAEIEKTSEHKNLSPWHPDIHLKACVAKWVGIHLAFNGWLWDGNCYGHHPFSIVRTSSTLGFRGRWWVLEWSKLTILLSPQQLQLGSEDLPGVGRCCIACLIKKPVWIEPSGQILSERNFLLCSSPEKNWTFLVSSLLWSWFFHSTGCSEIYQKESNKK